MENNYNFQGNDLLILIKYMGNLFSVCNKSDKIDCINYFKENMYIPQTLLEPSLVLLEAKNLPVKRAILYIFNCLTVNDRSIILNYSYY
jgi:hypothetical protein